MLDQRCARRCVVRRPALVSRWRFLDQQIPAGEGSVPARFVRRDRNEKGLGGLIRTSPEVPRGESQIRGWPPRVCNDEPCARMVNDRLKAMQDTPFSSRAERGSIFRRKRTSQLRHAARDQDGASWLRIAEPAHGAGKHDWRSTEKRTRPASSLTFNATPRRLG